MSRYLDRRSAGRELVGHLVHHRGEDPLVLGVARGGVVVAAEVAAGLGGELEAVVARKIGAPMSPELAIGAVAPDGLPVVDPGFVERLSISEEQLAELTRRSLEELRHRHRILGIDGDPVVSGRVVIVVDDGVATGATTRAVLGYLRRLGPDLLSVAVPVGPPATIDILAAAADEVVCPHQPEPFRSVGEWYEDFTQVSSDEALAVLGR